MSAKLVIIDPSRVSDGATVTASSFETELPPGNVQDVRLDEVWQSTSKTDEWLKFNFGQQRTFNCVAFTAHSMELSATVLIEGSNNDADWDVLLATQKVFTPFTGYGQGGYGRGGYGGFSLGPGIDPVLDHVFFVDLGLQSYQYVRITLSDPDSSDAFIRVGRMAVETLVAPGDYAWDYVVALTDPSKVNYTAGGQPRSENLAKFYRVDLEFRWTSLDTYWTVWSPVLERVGVTQDIFLLMDERAVGRPSHAQKSRFYGRFVSVPEYTANILGPLKAEFRQTR